MANRYQTKWLTFTKLYIPERKTEVWSVFSIHYIFLGYIKWFGRLRQYSFYPEENTIYNQECLNDISTFVKKLMDERK